MFYIGCLPILALILIVVIISVVRGILNTTVNVIYGLWLTIKEWFQGLFRPTPQESDLEDINYFHETQEREKLYTENDGEYVRFKNIKK